MNLVHSHLHLLRPDRSEQTRVPVLMGKRPHQALGAARPRCMTPFTNAEVPSRVKSDKAQSLADTPKHMSPSSPNNRMGADLPPAAHTTRTRTNPPNNHFEVPSPCLSTSTSQPRNRAETPRATMPSTRASQAVTRLWYRVARQCLFPIRILHPRWVQVLLGEQIFFLRLANSAPSWATSAVAQCRCAIAEQFSRTSTPAADLAA